MSEINSPIATSTPLNKPGAGLVLKEKQENVGIPRQQAQIQLKSKKPAKVGPQRKSLAKENAVKPPRNGAGRPTKVVDEEKAAKRRQQAIEAMKIQEQRRLRMCQQVLADELEQLTVSPDAGTSDELIKKRMEAKKLKEKRILAFIAEQESQKKKSCEDKVRSDLSSSTSFIIKTRRCLYKPRVLGYESPLPEVPEEPFFPELMRFRNIALPNRVIIRYSKDEIRSMNPYGYYFM